MTTCPLFTVDAFTTVPFRGNPASVCLLDGDLDAALMQAIAAEMMHAETAFVRPLDGPAERATRFALRWFTPAVEVPLCGHATLASAAAIFRELGNPAPALAFDTLSGTLAARREGDRVALDFPAKASAAAEAPTAVLDALGAPDPVGVSLERSGRNLLVRLSGDDQVRGLMPDIARLRAARGEASFVGVIVTATGSDGYDCVSRYFAPWLGVDEDPVTGSAHCALGPYWTAIAGKTELRAFQASRRGGELTMRVREDRVDLIGDAVVVAAGTLRLPS